MSRVRANALAVSRQLVELMGNRIGVKSEPGRGSTFWIEVPFAIERGGDAERCRLAAAARGAGPADTSVLRRGNRLMKRV